MIVLCAYYAGTVKPEHQSDYDAYVRNVHLDLVSRWPGLRKLRLLKNDGEPYLGEAPRYYQCFELTFDDLDGLEQSLRSPERDRTRERSIADVSLFRERFQGEVRHALYEETQFSPPIAGPSPAFLRCAYYKGTVAPADRPRFDEYIRDVHLPDVAAWPRLRHLRLLKNDDRVFVTEKPQYYQAFELAFDSQIDMDFCMASEERKETRRISARDKDSFKGLFEGEVHHVNYRCHDIPVKNQG
jgi:uncharacterized protein (TIGR02118 family)